MSKWSDYLVSKVKWKENTNVKRIESLFIHPDNGDSVGPGKERKRSWVVQKISDGYTFCTKKKKKNGKWGQGNSVTYKDGKINLNDNLPLLITKRKVFISYYHRDDKKYKEAFENLTEDLFVNKSVEEGDISSDVSDEYAKQLIQKGYLSDTTVLIVLIGPKTKCRKHVDWEISGALNHKVGNNYAGLLGLELPTHPDYDTNMYTPSEIPQRLADNLDSGYAVIRDYTTNRKKIQEYVELAFRKRKSNFDDRVNSRNQLQEDLCE